MSAPPESSACRCGIGAYTNILRTGRRRRTLGAVGLSAAVARAAKEITTRHHLWVGHAQACGCPETLHMSCDVLVFVEEAADAVVSLDLAELGPAVWWGSGFVGERVGCQKSGLGR